ncbi:hypothetical protein L2E82_21276 [Cichorium intybus]|uniref:Uncharacterized protein n=1 Tax=Cichorium intybus TaxID=13427 RepID=A0ACB9DVZ4_CICIN|nr:hypothetical protein L2E82_21276 [Cichorium intybus]
MFSSRELRSLVFRVATTLIHVRCKSVSSTPVTTSCPPIPRMKVGFDDEKGNRLTDRDSVIMETRLFSGKTLTSMANKRRRGEKEVCRLEFFMIDARASRGNSDGDREFGEEEEGKTRERSRDAMRERKRVGEREGGF